MSKKTCLITGVLGYVATELSKLYYNSEDYNVIGIDNNFIGYNVLELVKNDIKFYQYDLFNIKNLIDQADIIYHLASVTDSVPKTKEESNSEIDNLIYKTGILGTREIIKYARKDSKIIFASTQVLFEGLKEEVLNINEEFEPCPVLSYATSKRQSELDLFESNKNFIITRFASVYGWNHAIRYKIVANLFAKMAALNQNIKIFGEGTNFKPLVGIGDVARSLKFLAESNYNKEIFNIVNENTEVLEIAQICKKFNKNLQIEHTKDSIINNGYTLSNAKILKTGFKFQNNLETEISQMVKIWSNK